MRRFLTHAQIAAGAGPRLGEYLQDLEQVVVGRTPTGMWLDTARPAYAALVAKYPWLDTRPPGPSQKVPDGFRKEDWHLDSTGTPGRCCD